MKVRPEHVHSFFSMGSLMLWPNLKHENAALFLALPVHKPITNPLAHPPRLKLALEVQMRNGNATIIQQHAGSFKPSAVGGLFGPLHIFR
jgi:hypothetical protein